MQIEIALVKLSDGTESILRATPLLIELAFENAANKAGGGTIVCSVEGSPMSMVEEDELWNRFVVEAEKVGEGQIARDKHMVWRKKAWFLWTYTESPLGVCYFMQKENDMILQMMSRRMTNSALN